MAVVTSDGEVFTWGESVSGCLGHGPDTHLVTTPELVDTEEDIDNVVCGRNATALIAPDGRVMVAGDNAHNRLGMDTHTGVSTFQHVLENIGPVKTMSIGTQCSLVLTRAGDVYRIGGENR